jgi:cyanophycin synthetase
VAGPKAEPELLDSRRLTGPNLYGESPGAVVTLGFRDGFDIDAFIERWKIELGRGLTELGWFADLHVRKWVGEGQRGAELMFTARVDRLYAATDLNEWAFARARGEPEPTGALAVIAERATFEQARRQGLIELLDAADARGVPWLLDDDEVSLGYFDQCIRWPLGHERKLPSPAAIDWIRLGPRPVVLITGTNGKTTTTRLLARICRKQDLRVGNTSTDGLYLDERLIEAGDWTGPGGARAVLRNPDVEVALLEAARGGLLRRGSGVRRCAVAVITNIARDHLGEYGIVDLAGMAAAKGIVASIVEPSGRVVLGADSPALVAWAKAHKPPAPIVWFSLDPNSRVLKRAGKKAEVWTILGSQLVRIEGRQTTALCRIDEVPIALGGLARHNLANALAAAAAARGLGFGDAAIAEGLREFGSQPEDNPGRARLWQLSRPDGGRARLLLDFAHNLAGIAAITEVVRGLAGRGAERLTVCFGMAGDRSDADLHALAAALTALQPRRVILREQPEYARGRDPAEVPRVLERGLRAVSDVGIDHARDEIESLEMALADEALSRSDELFVVVLVHTERDEVDEWLRQRGATPSAS